MSYDVDLQIETGAGNFAIVCVRNVTYNNGCIFAYLGIKISELEGRTAGELVPELESALTKMAAEREAVKRVYRDAGMPENWGGYDDARDFLERFLDCCRDHPAMKVVVS